MMIIAFLIAVLVIVLLLIYFVIPQNTGRNIADKHYMMALNYLVNGNLKSALKELMESAKTNIYNVDVYLKLGEVLRKMGKLNKALQIHKKIGAQINLTDEQKNQLNINLIEDYIALKQYEKAIALIEKIIKYGSSNASYIVKLIHLLATNKEWSTAYQLQLKLDKINREKSNVKLAYFLAEQGNDIYTNEQKKSEAIDKFKYAIQLDAKCFPAYLYWGNLLYNEGDVDGALSKWIKILKDMPRASFLVHEKIEKAYYDKDKFDEVISLYEDVVSKNKKDNKTLLELANLYYKMQEIDLAIEKCKAVIENNVHDFDAHEFLLKIYIQQNEYEKAYNEIKEIKELFLNKHKKYICSVCGHRSDKLFLHCQKCGELYTAL